MECLIRIDGESARELFAAGPNDIRTFFLPEKLGVKEEDIAQITFEEPVKSEPYRYIVHKDNYYRNQIKKEGKIE